MVLACSAGQPGGPGTQGKNASADHPAPGKVVAPSDALRNAGATGVTFDGRPDAGTVTVFEGEKVVETVRFKLASDDSHAELHADRDGHHYDLVFSEKDGAELVVDGKQHAHAAFSAETGKQAQDEASKALFSEATLPLTIAAQAVAMFGENKAGGVTLLHEAPPSNQPRAGGAIHADTGGTCYVNGVAGNIVNGNVINASAWGNWTKTIGCYYATQSVNNACTNQYCWGCNQIVGCDCNCIVGDTICATCIAYGAQCDCSVPTPYCGDGFCQTPYENCGNCAPDCGCSGNQTCNGSYCVANCTINTTCGYDSCGNYHGCPSGYSCDSYGSCEQVCSLFGACGTDSCGIYHGCPGGQTCFNLNCCSPQSCQPGQCGDVDDGCGGTINCGPCNSCGSCGGGCGGACGEYFDPAHRADVDGTGKTPAPRARSLRR
ncbi:MAG TPA: hypothetical protein VF765_25555 [Polyangiaceae bacterium]